MDNNMEIFNKANNKISSWNKWDLHIHTPSTNDMVVNDYKNSEMFNEEIFIDKLYTNNVSLGVISDHNIFDAKRFEDLRKKIIQRNKIDNKNLVILPGVEINVNFKNGQEDAIHFILIFDENENLKEIQKSVEQLNTKTGFKKGNPKSATIDDIAEFFSKFEYIVSIHLGKSSNKPRGNNYDEFLKIFIGGFVNICENNPGNKIQNKEYLEKRVEDILGKRKKSIFIVGSDNHDITKYPLGENITLIPKLTYFKAIPSFEGLKMVITEPTRIYNSENDSLPNYINSSADLNKIEAIKLESNKIGTKEIFFSRELNTIIGSRTSGKSLLLNIIKNAFGKNYDVDKYGDYINDLKIKIKTFDDEEFKDNKSIQIEVFDQNSLMDEFIKIKSENDFFKDTYISKKFDQISLNDDTINNIYIEEVKSECDYIRYIDKLYNIVNKIKVPNVYMKNYIYFGKNVDEISDFYLNILNLKNFELNLINLTKQKNYLDSSIITIDNLIKNDHYNYIKSEELMLLNKLLNRFSLEVNIISKRINALTKVKKMDITKYKPFSVNQNFIEDHITFKNNIKKLAFLKKQLDNILKNDKLFENRTFKVNGLDKYEKSLKIRNFIFLSSIDFKTNFYTKEEEPKHIISKHFYAGDINCGWKKLVENVFLKKNNTQNLFKNGNVESIINEINLEKPKTYNTIIDEKGIDINNTSPGNRASVLISVILDNIENKVLIIDQPEDNLDSKFIYEEIVKKVKKLKESRQIFLVTHNSNIVINSDSENVICCKNNNNIINYEYGAIEYNKNIFENKNMKEYIMDNLEGTEEAFKLRNSKYFLKGDNKNGNNNIR